MEGGLSIAGSPAPRKTWRTGSNPGSANAVAVAHEGQIAAVAEKHSSQPPIVMAGVTTSQDGPAAEVLVVARSARASAGPIASASTAGARAMTMDVLVPPPPPPPPGPPRQRRMTDAIRGISKTIAPSRQRALSTGLAASRNDRGTRPAGNSRRFAPRRKNRPSMVALLRPTNMEEAKKQFMQSECRVSPVFRYSTKASTLQNLLASWSTVSWENLDVAVGILERTLETFGSDVQFYEQVGGVLLEKDRLLDMVDQYLEFNGLPGRVEVSFREEALAPAAMGGPFGNTLIIGWPIRQHEHRFRGVLDHEIGTHFIRRINDRQQCWHKARRRVRCGIVVGDSIFGSRTSSRSENIGASRRSSQRSSSAHPDGRSVPSLKHCLRTEEGLASLNTLVGAECKLLWRPALHYYSVCRGAQLSFADLFADLRRYISDVDRCWEQCVRVKRGFEDTSQHGAFTKDQVYLDGALRILAERDQLDFRLLYAGQVSLDDVHWISDLADLSNSHVPQFLRDVTSYKSSLEDLIEQNGLGGVLAQRALASSEPKSSQDWSRILPVDMLSPPPQEEYYGAGYDDCGGCLEEASEQEMDDYLETLTDDDRSPILPKIIGASVGESVHWSLAQVN
eukprot:TRINITY_DN13925_c0_g1_i1.p1 TRINITY_DN13925_c0_g1~~TRINITY_DN13925_c0_g1_i1.p1  ORF type:complete len:621 (-),score=90.92 TRINITY_DN13925_c0_g1_i1:433-2295(-)